MIFAIYESSTNRLTGAFDTETHELKSYTSFDVREYGDGFQPIIEYDDDSDVYLVDNCCIWDNDLEEDEETNND